MSSRIALFALDAEVDWIMDGTIDVYGGTGNDRTILPDGGRGR